MKKVLFTELLRQVWPTRRDARRQPTLPTLAERSTPVPRTRKAERRPPRPTQRKHATPEFTLEGKTGQLTVSSENLRRILDISERVALRLAPVPAARMIRLDSGKTYQSG